MCNYGEHFNAQKIHRYSAWMYSAQEVVKDKSFSLCEQKINGTDFKFTIANQTTLTRLWIIEKKNKKVGTKAV